MLISEQHDRPARTERDMRDNLDALIGEQILHTLGEPGDLLRVQVRRLWEDHYRVNVFVGADLASARLAHSYFVVTDVDGYIAMSIPEITKQY